MIDSIKENNFSWGETIGNNRDYIKLYCINTCKKEEERRLQENSKEGKEGEEQDAETSDTERED